MLIPLLTISLSAVLVICVDVSTICLVRSFIMKFQYVISTVYAMFMIYSWINLIRKFLIFTTIQKPNLCRQFSIQGFAAALKPTPFMGTYFKCSQMIHPKRIYNFFLLHASFGDIAICFARLSYHLQHILD